MSTEQLVAAVDVIQRKIPKYSLAKQRWEQAYHSNNAYERCRAAMLYRLNTGKTPNPRVSTLEKYNIMFDKVSQKFV